MLFYSLFLLILLINMNSSLGIPFLQTNKIHPIKSDLGLHLVLSENRNLPILMVTYSRKSTQKIMRNMIQGAFEIEPDIFLALMMDCNDFQHDIKQDLNVCTGYDTNQQPSSEDINNDKINDQWFKLQLAAPNSKKIKVKGHLLISPHELINLRQINMLFNSEQLAKTIRGYIYDSVVHVEDSYDEKQFLHKIDQYYSKNIPKLLYFDDNLQAPYYLKKLALILDQKITVGVSDSQEIAKKYNANFEEIVLLEYNIMKEQYESIKIQIQSNQRLKSILNHKTIKLYTKIGKARDMLTDFEFKDPIVYRISTLGEFNQLLTHGRLILMLNEKQSPKCSQFNYYIKEYESLLNYVCMNDELATQMKLTEDQSIYLFYPRKWKQYKIFKKNSKISIYDNLPQQPITKKVYSTRQALICTDTAAAAKTISILFNFNQKSNSYSKKIMQYLHSLPQWKSLITFCQIYLPNQQFINKFNLTKSNYMIHLSPDQKGNFNKLESQKVESFVQIKSIVRQLVIQKMKLLYSEKLQNNKLYEANLSTSFSDKCYDKPCIIGLIATNSFRWEQEIQMLKEMKFQFEEEGYQFVWIDGICHYDIPKQLKILNKKEKVINQTYLFRYSEKDNKYILWKEGSKFWTAQQAGRWIKSLRTSSQFQRLKYSLDLQEREKCPLLKNKNSSTQEEL